MRVAIEARALTAKSSGVKRYVAELVQSLKEAGPSDEFLILPDGPRYNWLLPWYLDASLPQKVKRLRPDVIHYTKAAMPMRKVGPSVVTIYDVIPILFPQSQNLPGRWMWPSLLKQAARGSDHILTISEASKSDIVQQLDVRADKVTITKLAVDTTKFRPTLATRLVERTSGHKPYILFVGTIEPRKNVPLLIRSFARIAAKIPHRLVIAGRSYKGEGEVEEAIRQSGIAERVKRIVDVPGADLPALYTNAELLVCPSVYEGWGFPPQEAMACGVPVIVSDGGSLPEVVESAGKVVPFAVPLADRVQDTDFEQRLAVAMQEVLASLAERARMRQMGFDQAKKFSWSQVAEQTLDVYRQVSR